MTKIKCQNANPGPEMSAKLNTNMDFESSLKQLEEIVRELESGEVSLDKSLARFEQGIELYKKCRATLESAEKKIKILSDSLKEIDYKE